jgi:hypothetical protein
MYQVGFGDCFLLSFDYGGPLPDGRAERHVLIDFGSTSGPESGPSMRTIARSIAERCGGQLDALVVTHRHKDHLSGLGTQDTGPIIEDLRPRLVVRSWTEDPDAAETALGPAQAGAPHAFAALLQYQVFAKSLAAWARETDQRLRTNQVLATIAFDQLGNQAAINRLERMSTGGRGEYLSFGALSRLAEVVPGITVHVIGPPTPRQVSGLQLQTDDDAAEYWMFSQSALPAAAPPVVPGQAALDVEAGPCRWIVERTRQQGVSSALRIVRWLDDAMNNTSVILVLEIGRKVMLFGGDAQIENWRYSLLGDGSSAALTQLLRRVDLYKVGHHGSRNATPRSLFELWRENAGHEMVALLSTKCCVHGERPETRVPRATLVDALRERTALFSTTGLRRDEAFVEVRGDPASDAPFQLVQPLRAPTDPADPICADHDCEGA